ncbi:MAG: methyltransferase domain-containing protein [Sphingobacteriaceae bacterium]|nr:methyltransferase domain-containing protein [Sphingobacteriaceae bacterium]
MFHFLLRTIPRPILISLSLIFSKIAPFIYYGKRYEDPISGKTYRKFLPYGYGGRAKRKNVLCPGSLSLERHRLLWLYLKDKTNFFTAKHKVLHIAPEQCFYKIFRKMENLDYTTGDYNSPIADIHFDLHSAPFKDNTFDVIFCNHVLEHVNDANQCMRELYRIMRPGGWGIFQVPLDATRETTLEDKNIITEADREKHYWQKDHLRLFGLDYKDKLTQAGFQVIVDDYVNTLGEKLIDRYRLPKGEMIYFCRK